MRYGVARGDDWIDVVVTGVVRQTADVVMLELGMANGGEMPGWTPGSHVAVRCGPEIVRHYSLCGPAERADRYRLGIKLDPNGRAAAGGWASMHVPERPCRSRGPATSSRCGWVGRATASSRVASG